MSAGNYIDELLQEKSVLDPLEFKHTIRLLNDEISLLQSNNELTDRDFPIQGGPSKQPAIKEEIIKLTEKIMVPVDKHPKFNFVGKLLGPKGNTLKRLQASTQARVSILGRGSTRDKDKEEELSKSDDPKHAHFKETLHIIVEVEAPKSEAHQRFGAALSEIHKLLVPENDEIRQEQMREMAMLNNTAASSKLVTRGPVPIIKVGIPPPGAIVLRESAITGVRPPDPYLYDKYVTTYNATYEGYPETGPSSGLRGKLVAPANGYVTKKFAFANH